MTVLPAGLLVAAPDNARLRWKFEITLQSRDRRETLSIACSQADLDGGPHNVRSLLSSSSWSANPHSLSLMHALRTHPADRQSFRPSSTLSAASGVAPSLDRPRRSTQTCPRQRPFCRAIAAVAAATVKAHQLPLPLRPSRLLTHRSLAYLYQAIQTHPLRPTDSTHQLQAMTRPSLTSSGCLPTCTQRSLRKSSSSSSWSKPSLKTCSGDPVLQARTRRAGRSTASAPCSASSTTLHLLTMSGPRTRIKLPPSRKQVHRRRRRAVEAVQAWIR